MNLLTRRPSTPVAYVLWYSVLAVIVFVSNFVGGVGVTGCLVAALVAVAVLAAMFEGVPRLVGRSRRRAAQQPRLG